MTQAVPLPRHDFQDPRRLPAGAWKALTQWITDAVHLTQETWQPMLTSANALQVVAVDAHEIREAFALIPQPGVGVQLKLGSDGIPGLLVLTQRQALALLSDLLGDRETEWPTARDVTELEQSLLGMLFQQFAHAVGESWPGAKPISSLFVDFVDRPHRTRLFAPDAALISVKLRIKSRFGEDDVLWLLPMDEIEQLIRSETTAADAATGEPATIHEELALQLPVTMVVELGRTQLKMSEIAALRAGDVIVLDQAITRTLQTYVGDRVKFRGNPGRVGPRQALVIESSAGDANGTATSR